MTTTEIDTVNAGHADHRSTAQPKLRGHRLWLLRSAWSLRRLQHWIADGYQALMPWLLQVAAPWAGRRFREIRNAWEHGLAGATVWIRAVLATVAVTTALLTVNFALTAIADFWRNVMIGPGHHGVIATITGPVHTYIDQDAATLPAGPAIVWSLWQAAGPSLLVWSALKSRTARILWVAYGASSLAMVSCAAPPAGRAIAVALAATVWVVFSALALHDVRLTPVVSVQLRMTVHHTAPASDRPYSSGTPTPTPDRRSAL